MKTITQISKEYKVSESTLRDRAKANKIVPLKFGGSNFYDLQQEKMLLVKPDRGIPKHLTANKELILSFKLQYPMLLDEEVAGVLGIDLERVKIAFKQDYLILPSKINKE